MGPSVFCFFFWGGGGRRPRLRYWQTKNHRNWSKNDRNRYKSAKSVIFYFAGNNLHSIGDTTTPILKLKNLPKKEETMTSLSYGRVFCLEFQRIDGTEYLRGSTDLAILFLLLN